MLPTQQQKQLNLIPASVNQTQKKRNIICRRRRILIFIVFLTSAVLIYGVDVFELLFLSDTALSDHEKKQRNEDMNREYSSVQCIGNEGNIPPVEQTLCRFDNICYWLNHSNNDTKGYPKGTFLYFENESNPPDYIINNFGKILHDFTDFRFMLKHNHDFEIKMKKSSIKSINASKILWLDENVVFHQPFFPSNFGHCLGDDWLSTYRVLSKFGLYSAQKCRVVFLNYFDTIFWGGKEADRKRIERSNNFYDNINPYLYDHPYIFLTHFEQKQRMKEIDYLCFNTAVISSYSFVRQSFYPFEWTDFLNIFLNKHPVHQQKIKQLYARGKQRVLFLSKSDGWHGRAWANNDTKTEIVDYLSNLFKIEIDRIYDYQLNNLSLYEQINFALDYTVLIAPAGALSYLGAFMAPNTCVIQKDVFHWRNKRSHHLDWWIWNYQYSKCIFYLTSNQSDAKFALPWDKMLAKGDGQLSFAFRDAASFYLHPKKVAYAVYNALNWVEKRLNWKDTYYLPDDWQKYIDV